jgi:hypothetical protein
MYFNRTDILLGFEGIPRLALGVAGEPDIGGGMVNERGFL